MMNEAAVASLANEAWARRRRRARLLAERYAFVTELLRLYEALLDVQEPAFMTARDDRPDPARLAAYAADRVMSGIIDATLKAGPAALGAAAGEACSGGPAERGCPRCGGLPQLSYLADAGETLVSGPRMLLCCRCGESWVHQRMTCPGCGEQATSKLPIFADAERFPHLRADACESCRTYVITIDLRKEAGAVPVVDELVALPLDLYVQARGFAKVVPNLMAIG